MRRAALLLFAALVPIPAASQPATPRRPEPWWADSTKWPPGTFRRTTTRRPPQLIAVGDTLRLPGPALPAGLPDSIARDVRWSSDDPRVLLAEPGLAVGRAAGEATAIAWTRVGPTLTPVRVVAALRGRLHTADGMRPPAARVLVRRASGRVDTLPTAADGRFALPLTGARAAESDAPVALRVEPAPGPGGAAWFAAEAPLPRPFAGAPADVVLVPRRWRVDGGTFAGTELAVSLDDARARAADGSRFWRAARLAPDAAAGESAGQPVGWPDDRRPIPLAVLGARGAPAGAADSAAFWGVARALERDWGAPLFRPVSSAEARRGDWAGIAAQVTPGLHAPGFATVTWDADGRIADALVEVRTRALLGDRHLVAHELLHALGFGHASRWRSVLGGVHAPGDAPAALTREDVAYGRLLDAARRVARRTGAAFGIAEAVDF